MKGGRQEGRDGMQPEYRRTRSFCLTASLFALLPLARSHSSSSCFVVKESGGGGRGVAHTSRKLMERSQRNSSQSDGRRSIHLAPSSSVQKASKYKPWQTGSLLARLVPRSSRIPFTRGVSGNGPKNKKSWSMKKSFYIYTFGSLGLSRSLFAT